MTLIVLVTHEGKPLPNPSVLSDRSKPVGPGDLPVGHAPECRSQEVSFIGLSNQLTAIAQSSETNPCPSPANGHNPAQELDPLATLPLDKDAGEKHGRYHILRPHAQGGLGRVLVAKDDELQREVALKEIRPDYAHDVECRARFMREAEITGRLEHPGIVPVYSLGTYPDGSPYYAMRFIRGTSLQDAIKKFHGLATRKTSAAESQRNLELRRLVQRLAHVCQTVDYSHSRGVIHRDIKPSNIMLGPYGETLVVDWGLAKAIGKQLSPATAAETRPDASCGPGPSIVALADSDSAPTQLGAAVGTPAYMSPEQALGRHDVLGPASDVFSLGATLYEVLTGVPPYRGQDFMRRAQQADFSPPKAINRHVPRLLDAICLKAMASQPKDRYASAGEMAQELERYLADEPLLARPDRGLDRLFRFARRHRAWAQAGAMALGLIAIVATLAAVSIHGSLRRAERAEESAVQNLIIAEAARRQEAARAEAEALQRKRAEAAEEMARSSAASATTERDRAEREKRIVELIVAEHAPSLLRLPGEYFADRQSLSEFAAALVTARQADATAENRNRHAIATFARLLSTKKVFRDEAPTNPAFDRYLFEKVVLPALTVQPPESLTPDDKRQLALLWAAKARLLERNPIRGFLAAAGVELDDAADEFTEAMLVAHTAYRRSYELSNDIMAAAGALRISSNLPPRLIDWPRYEAEISELSKQARTLPEKIAPVLQLAEARQCLRQAGYSASPTDERALYREAIDRLGKLEATTRSADPYLLRGIASIIASEACLALSRLVPVRSSDEAIAGNGGQTKFACLNQAMDWAILAERDRPSWSHQAGRLARANVLEELAYHYKDLSRYKEACELYDQCLAEARDQDQAVVDSNRGRCELRWSLDAWRICTSYDERTKHLRSAFQCLTRALDHIPTEGAVEHLAAEAHFWLGKSLFHAACDGPGRLDLHEQQGAAAGKSLHELTKTLSDGGRSAHQVRQIRERLAQIDLACQAVQTAAELSRKTSSWRWIELAHQAAIFEKYLIDQQVGVADDNRTKHMPERVNELQALVNRLLESLESCPSAIAAKDRRRVVELDIEMRRFSSLTANKSAPLTRYEMLFPEDDEEALLQRLLLLLSDAGGSQVAMLRQADAITRQMKQPALVNLAQGHCEKAKGDLLYGPFRDRVLGYTKSPDLSSGLNLSDDPKLSAVQHLYAAALQKFNSSSDSNTIKNLRLIYGMKLKDIEDGQWPRTFSPLEAEWLRRSIEESEPVRNELFKLMSARLYLHGKEWDLKDAQTPLDGEALVLARQIVQCLKPIRFLEIYFCENKLDDYQRTLLQICESRCGST